VGKHGVDGRAMAQVLEAIEYRSQRSKTGRAGSLARRVMSPLTIARGSRQDSDVM
jgi:hypothetical protein